ncbi:MAG: ABC-2 family transporter protein, partial [Dehalococcoidia bacterium]|nr:ABC-2 family transporter protein [Dehalococcoidia bacterium]
FGVMAWASIAMDVSWSATDVALLIGTIAGGVCIFIGLVVLQATLAFWTTETLEIMNTVTYGGVETTQYPLAIYRPWFQRLFTFGVPLGCVSYFPALAIIGKPDPLGSPLWFQYAAPMVGIIFLLVALRVWHFGERRYLSTGS